MAWHSSGPLVWRRVSSSNHARRSLSNTTVEANATLFSASTLDTLSSASLSARAAQSSATLTWRAALSHAARASQAEVSMISIDVAWAASVVAATSHTLATSAYNAGTPMLHLNKRCGNKTQEK
jgi:hypothetical protein